MLSDRRERVLAALIEEYVARALPVGSRTLTERYDLGVSSATIRNELSVLEDEGYISQPHTSAGRVPTDSGYRAFVDRLVSSGAFDEGDESEEGKRAVEELRQSATELDDLLEKTNNALARLTDCLSVVISPRALRLLVRQVTLVSLSDRQAILVVVTADGQVFNRRIDFAEPVPPEDLAGVQRLVNSAIDGSDAEAIEGKVAADAAALARKPVVAAVLDEVLDCLREHEQARTRRQGMSSLLRKPEFSQSESLIPIVQVLEDDTVLLRVLDAPSGEGEGDGMPSVRIGREIEGAGLSGLSIVASRYGRSGAAGVVAVIGPTRMDYSKVIKAVRLASAALEDED